MTYLRKLWKRIEEAQQKRADYIMLTSFSDRELRDLGIGRSEIRGLIYDK